MSVKKYLSDSGRINFSALANADKFQQPLQIATVLASAIDSYQKTKRYLEDRDFQKRMQEWASERAQKAIDISEGRFNTEKAMAEVDMQGKLLGQLAGKQQLKAQTLKDNTDNVIGYALSQRWVTYDPSQYAFVIKPEHMEDIKNYAKQLYAIQYRSIPQDDPRHVSEDEFVNQVLSITSYAHPNAIQQGIDNYKVALMNYGTNNAGLQAQLLAQYIQATKIYNQVKYGISNYMQNIDRIASSNNPNEAARAKQIKDIYDSQYRSTLDEYKKIADSLYRSFTDTDNPNLQAKIIASLVSLAQEMSSIGGELGIDPKKLIINIPEQEKTNE